MSTKLLAGLCLTPPGINLLLMLLSYALHIVSPRFSHRCFFFNIILLYFFATPLFFYGIVERLELTHPVKDFSQKADAIVLLGGGNWHAPEYIDTNVQPTPFALQRVKYAAYLSKKTKLPIITSGGTDHSCQGSESSVFTEILNSDYGIKSILEETQSRNTNENGKFVKDIADKKKIKTIYLVTNAYHMKRAQYIFEYYGFKVIPAPTGFFGLQKPQKIAALFIPSSYTLFQTQLVLMENIGYAAYHFAGHPY